MMPWGHAAVGYLAYQGVASVRRGWPFTGLPVWVALLGSQLPDLIDKPLAWTLAVLPGGRTLGHSLLTAAIVLGVLWIAAEQFERDDGRLLVAALGIGWLSHVAADGLHAVVGGRFDELSYAVWPLLPLPDYETPPSFLAHFAAYRLDGFAALEVALVVGALAVWWRARVASRSSTTTRGESPTRR